MTLPVLACTKARFASKETGELIPVIKSWWVTNWWLEFYAIESRAGLYEFEVGSSL